MVIVKNSMAKILKNLNQKLVLVYCFGYVLRLSVSDFINKVTNLDQLGSLKEPIQRCSCVLFLCQ